MCRTINIQLPPPAASAVAASAPVLAGSTSSPSSSSSSKSAANFSLHSHGYPRDWRRRSADVGGLHLALAAGGVAPSIDVNDAASASGRDSWARETFNNGNEAGTFGAQGQGWMGGEPGDIQTMFAELLSDMYVETQNSVNDNTLESTPPQAPESTRTRLIWSLSRWNFEPHLLEEEDILTSTLILFEVLYRIEGMEETIPVSMQQITAFIHHLRRIYRYENTYHNFEHALDVLQATQSYLRSAGIVPQTTILFEPEDRKWRIKKRPNSDSLIGTLGLRELFMLYVAAIGHDVGHPGFNNHFMKNAQAPLSLIYHNSALEQMHCQLLLKVMRQHGLGALLDDPTHGAHCRKVLVQSILTTDMSVHDEFMGTLKGLVDGEQAPLCTRQIVMCQAILKNADISNPTRPFLVSKHWASALMKEWFAQASLEEEYGVKQTVYPSSNPIDEANGQIFFISRFAKPLLELTERAIPEMRMYVTHCKSNLKEWNRRKKMLKDQELKEKEKEKEKEKPGAGPSSTSSSSSPASSSPSLNGSSSASTSMSPRLFQCYHSAFRLTLPPQQPASSSSSDPSSSSSTSGAKSERDQDSVPDSPSETESISSSAVFSPISESSSLHSGSHHSHSHSHRFPSNASNVSAALSVSNTNRSPSLSPSLLSVPAPHAAIRAASKVGSLRKKSQTNLNEVGISSSSRKGVRNSWCSGVDGAGGFAAFFQAQTQLQLHGSGILNGNIGSIAAATGGGSGSSNVAKMENGNGNGTKGSPNPPPASAPPNMNGQALSSSTGTGSSSFKPVKLQVLP